MLTIILFEAYLKSVLFGESTHTDYSSDKNTSNIKKIWFISIASRSHYYQIALHISSKSAFNMLNIVLCSWCLSGYTSLALLESLLSAYKLAAFHVFQHRRNSYLDNNKHNEELINISHLGYCFKSNLLVYSKDITLWKTKTNILEAKDDPIRCRLKNCLINVLTQ